MIINNLQKLWRGTIIVVDGGLINIGNVANNSKITAHYTVKKFVSKIKALKFRVFLIEKSFLLNVFSFRLGVNQLLIMP